MRISTIDESQRKAARVAGFTSLFTMAIVSFAYLGIQARLIVAGNAAETARNIMAHERLFRINIACDLIYCAGVAIRYGRAKNRMKDHSLAIKCCLAGANAQKFT